MHRAVSIRSTGSFPYWPAVVFEKDDPEVPSVVLANAPEHRDNSVALVRFYEKKSKSNWYSNMFTLVRESSLLTLVVAIGLG